MSETHWIDSYLELWDELFAALEPEDPLKDPKAVFFQKQLMQPFFRLDLTLGLDLEKVAEYAKQPRSVHSNLTFEEYERVSRSPISQVLDQISNTPPDDNRVFKLLEKAFDRQYLWFLSLTGSLQFEAFSENLAPLIVQLLKELIEGRFQEADTKSFLQNSLPCFHVSTVRLLDQQPDREEEIKAAWEPFLEAVANLADGRIPIPFTQQEQEAYIDFCSSIFGFMILSGRRLGLKTAIEKSDHFIHIRRAIGDGAWHRCRLRARIKYCSVALFLVATRFPYQIPFDADNSFSARSFHLLRDSLVDLCNDMQKSNAASQTSVFRYFIGKIDASEWRSRGYFNSLYDFIESDQILIQNLVDRFRLYRYPVTLEKMVSFLRQFSSGANIRLALNVLKHIRFFTLGNLQSMLEHAFEEIGDHQQCKLFCPLGDFGGSTSLMSYLTSHWNLENSRFLPSIGDALLQSNPTDPICLFDDGIYSGTQVVNILADLLGIREVKSHHTQYCQPLEDPDAFLKRPIRLCFAIACDKGIRNLEKHLEEFGFKDIVVSFSRMEIESVKPFERSMSEIWDTDEDRVKAKDLFSRIGRELLSDIAVAKGWPSGRDAVSSLGFGNDQRLIVYQYNVPKSTITALWKAGEFKGERWEPLFRLDG